MELILKGAKKTLIGKERVTYPLIKCERFNKSD